MSHNPRLSLAAITNGITTTASYTLDDNLIVYGDNTYSYNDDGYLVDKTTPNGTTTYRYGTMGELLSVTMPAKTITYQHNALNQRVAKLVDGEVVEKYLWADLSTLLAVYDADDTLIQRFEYADGRMLVAMTDKDGNKYYLHYDQVGSLRAVSRVLSPDNTTKLIKELTYDTFGNILTDSNPSFKVPFGFAGGLYDTDTKLTRFGYRDYDAYTGKWTAKDPIGFAGGDSNLYEYVLGDPVGFIDPMGLWDPARDVQPNFTSVPNQQNINNWNNSRSGYGRSFPNIPYIPSGPFGGKCGTEGSPWANYLPDATPIACEQHDKCYSTCGRSKMECDFIFLFWSPIYGAAVIVSPVSQDAYDKAQEHCMGGCNSW